ncbi:MAG: 4Fe-4S binding protein [Candidatus Odinarchaeota archaeon]
MCFVDAIKIIENHTVISNQCRGCSRCVEICPQKAIEIIIADMLYTRKSIEKIEKVIDLD